MVNSPLLLENSTPPPSAPTSPLPVASIVIPKIVKEPFTSPLSAATLPSAFREISSLLITAFASPVATPTPTLPSASACMNVFPILQNAFTSAKAACTSARNSRWGSNFPFNIGTTFASIERSALPNDKEVPAFKYFFDVVSEAL